MSWKQFNIADGESLPLILQDLRSNFYDNRTNLILKDDHDHDDDDEMNVASASAPAPRNSVLVCQEEKLSSLRMKESSPHEDDEILSSADEDEDNEEDDEEENEDDDNDEDIPQQNIPLHDDEIEGRKKLFEQGLVAFMAENKTFHEEHSVLRKDRPIKPARDLKLTPFVSKAKGGEDFHDVHDDIMNVNKQEFAARKAEYKEYAKFVPPRAPKGTAWSAESTAQFVEGNPALHYKPSVENRFEYMLRWSTTAT